MMLNNNMKQKEYRVGVWETTYGILYITANNPDEAKEKAKKQMCNGVGIEDTRDWQFGIEDVEEL